MYQAIAPYRVTNSSLRLGRRCKSISRKTRSRRKKSEWIGRKNDGNNKVLIGLNGDFIGFTVVCIGANHQKLDLPNTRRFAILSFAIEATRPG